MKRLISYLVCAALVTAGGFAYQKVKATDVPIKQGNTRLQFVKKVQCTENQQITSGTDARVSKNATEAERKERRAEMQVLMVANASTQAVLTDPTPVNPPFACDFEADDSFDNNWTVDNRNGDGYTWSHDLYSYAPLKVASVYCGNYGGNDYLVTKNPIVLEQGAAHMLFDYCSFSPLYKESAEVLYGTSPNVKEMQQIAEYVDFTTPSSREPNKAVINFDVPEAGNYYFAIHYNPDSYEYGMWVDNVTIDKGRFVGTPDIAITDVTLPAPSMELSASEKVSVTVANQGTAGIESYSLSWSAECNGVSQMSPLQTINVPLTVGASTTIEMDMPVNMVNAGAYMVTVTASNVVATAGNNEESNVDNNVMSAGTVHFGVTDVPFVTDFVEGEQLERWASAGGWVYQGEPINSMVCAEVGSLVSCGVNLTAGQTYKLQYVYMAGYYSEWGGISEMFDLRYGLSGESMETIASKTEMTDGAFVLGEESFTCDETGVYQFAIAQDFYPGGSLCISSVRIVEVNDYDLSMMGVQPGYPTMLPISQASGNISMNVRIKNAGLNNCSGTLSYTVGDAVGQQVAIPEVAPGDTIIVPVEFKLPEVAVGSSVDVKFDASITGQTDNDMTDNNASASIMITEDVLAYDQVTEYDIEAGAIGSPYGSIMLGLPIHLASEDILTGISAGWAYADGQEIRLVVYEFDPSDYVEDGGLTYYILGDELYSGSVSQGSKTGQIEYEISPKVLPAGDYMVCVEFADYCMAIDSALPGILYSVDSGVAVNQDNLGVPALRAIFGSTLSRNLTMDGIISLTDEAIFASNQPIEVQVTNNGSESVTGEVNVTINGKALEMQNITLDAFTKGSCTFVADLSAVGEYKIKATVTLDGDENPEDNSTEMTVKCVESLDPYVMDFEGCADFSTDWFNPAWTTVDGDGFEVYGLDGVSFPIPAGGVGFMAFNPYETYPALVDYAPYTKPCSGERYGMTLYSNTGEANDDWLISPLLKMPMEEANVTMQVQSFDDRYGIEEYEVCVSTTDNNPESFTVVYSGEAPVEEWGKVTVDLSKYNGQDIYVAIHCVSKDVFFFMIDDIVVSKPASGVEESVVGETSLRLYPNPVSETMVISAAGQEIKSVDIYSVSGARVGMVEVAGSEVRYNVSSLAQGVYVARVNTSAGTKVMRFMVK